MPSGEANDGNAGALQGAAYRRPAWFSRTLDTDLDGACFRRKPEFELSRWASAGGEWRAGWRASTLGTALRIGAGTRGSYGAASAYCCRGRLGRPELASRCRVVAGPSSFDSLRMRSSARSSALMVSPSKHEGVAPTAQVHLIVNRPRAPLPSVAAAAGWFRTCADRARPTGCRRSACAGRRPRSSASG